MATKFEINLPDGNGGYTPGHPKTEVAQIADATEFMRTLLMTAEDADSVRSQIGAGTGSGGGGAAPTLGIGTVTTGAAGSNAAASITDNGNSSYSLNLTIPKGDTGAAGANGSNGSSPVVSSTITVSTLAAGSSATASWSGAGTSASPLKLSLGIPRGATGATGATGSAGASGAATGSVSTSGKGYAKIPVSGGGTLLVQYGVYLGSGVSTVTLPTAFADTNYIISFSINETPTTDTASASYSWVRAKVMTASTFKLNLSSSPKMVIAIGKG